MTVAELIEELQKVENKDLQIHWEDNEYGTQFINSIYLHDANAWDNPNDPFNKYYIFQ